MTRVTTTPRLPLRRFSRETRGSASVELVIVLPILLWALAATVVFYDAFRARYHAQMAAQTIADVMSRETDLFTSTYVEGINGVFDFLVGANIPTRIRVSSIIWDSTNNRNSVQWSYGTRGMAALPENTFELMQIGDTATLLSEFGTDTTLGFAGAATQMPVSDLASRIPPILPGEAMLLVETFALWTPFANVGLGLTRFNPVVPVRPRFAPWINFEGIDPVYPEVDYEVSWAGGAANDSLPDPNDDVATPDASGTSYTFDAPGTVGWSSSTRTVGSVAGGSYLGPFGTETYDHPVTFSVNLGTTPAIAAFDFDLMLFDSWDAYDPNWALPRGDTLSLLFNGSPISMDAFVTYTGTWNDNARSATGYIDGMQYEIRMTRTQSGTNFGQMSDQDALWHVNMAFTNPPQHFTLGFSAGVNDPIYDESFGLDIFRYSITGSNSGQPFFAPDPNLQTGTDPFTRFRRYAGCPDYRISAPWLTMTNANVRGGLTIQRQVGGHTDLGACTTIPGFGGISAEPSLVFNYDNQGASGTGRRLQLMLDDGNNGYTCDSTILVRDPNGQWWFNDDISGWNAGLQMGNAVSGIYTIWLGSYNIAECNSHLRFGAY